jgi:hypothetical protein
MSSSGSSPSVPALDPGKLFVAAPNYKGASGSFLISMLKLQTALGKRGGSLWPWTIENESNIDRARGKAMAAFLATDASHLLFIDSDIGIDGEAICQMRETDKPIICATIAMKTLDFARIVEVARANPGLTPEACVAWGTTFAFAGDPQEFDDLLKPQKIHRGGTGVMLIRRDVVAALWAKHYATLGCMHQGVYFVNLFQCTIDRTTGDQIGTDYSFCDRAREAGFETWLAPWVQTTHRGEYTFKASLLDLA